MLGMSGPCREPASCTAVVDGGQLARPRVKPRKDSHETYVPAQQPAPAQEARLPSAHAYSCGPLHSGQPSQQGPRSPHGVTMLARDDRLHPRSRVRSTIRHGRRVRSGSLVVHFVGDDQHPHAAVVVGKGFRGAVERHRRQRQVRHAVWAMWEDLPAGSLVIRALPADTVYEQLLADLRKAVRRL